MKQNQLRAPYFIAPFSKCKANYFGHFHKDVAFDDKYFGKEASKFTETHLFVGRMVYLEKDISEVDRYNRLLRYVWIDVPKSLDEKEINSKKFHHINCSAGGRTLEHNRTYFKTRQEAINAGYVPCKVCNP